MLKSQTGKSVARKPLADISNGGKSLKSRRKKIAEESANGALDCLLLVRSDLANLVSKIDELIAEAIEHKVQSKKVNQDIESFRNVLSDMHSSLKPWFLRLQQAFAGTSITSENQLGQPLNTNSASGAHGDGNAVRSNKTELQFGQPFNTNSVSGAKGDGNAVQSNKTKTELDLIVSPSPLVSWRAGACMVESGRQLFLLTPLPKSKTYSSKCPGSSKSVVGIYANEDQCNLHELPPLLPGTNNALSNVMERADLKHAPHDVPKPIAIETKNSTLESGYVSPWNFSNYKGRKNSYLLTPCLKTSPPKSCALLDPISERFQLDEIPTQANNDPKLADDLASEEVSDTLASRYQELLGLQPAPKVTSRRKEVDELDWFLSPPKTCILMEPSDEKPPTTPANNDLLLGTPMLKDFQSTILTGILLLAEILNCLMSKPLDIATISSLVEFFTSKLADWQVLRGALIGCLALLRRKKNVGMVKSSEARALAESYLMNVQVQSLAVHDRKLCFEVLQCLLEVYPEAVEMLGDDLIYGICEAIDEEKDPRCLMLTFHLVEILARVFPDSSGSVASFAGDLFDILSRYFPIYFTHPRSDDLDITREELSRALMHAFCSTPFFEPFAIPLLLEKLSSSLPLAKVDSLKYLNNCIQHYGTDRMIKHAKAIWSNLKDVIFNHSPHKTLFSTSESAGNMESEENQIAKEALICLQTTILHLDSLEKDPVLSFIVEDDEDIEMKFGLVSNEGTGTGISIESRRQLSAVGNILSVSSKASMSGCTRVFQKFFPRLMNILEISASSSSYGCNTNNGTSSLNFGALYLCIQLLASCRELILTSQDFSPQVITKQDGWWCMLQRFSGPLAHALGSALMGTRSSELVNNNTGHERAIYAVKGLQVLATFPDCYLPISEDVYEYILVMLMSIVTERFEDTFLWKLSVKALIEIGSFIEKYHDSYRGISFSRVVVERIVSLFQQDDSTMPVALKLDAISEIGTIGVDYMSRVIKLLEEAILSKYLAVCVEGRLEAAEILVLLLECYSNRVLLWCYTSGNFDEVAMRFSLCIWNQMESITSFDNDAKNQDLLDRIMTTMKLLVGGCAEENQSLIVWKAYSVLLSTSFLSEESLPFSSSKLEGLQLTPDLVNLSWRDEWILSLFASVVIALRPQTPLPYVKLLVNVLTTFLLKGHLPAAQALASMVNKWHGNIDKSEVPSAYTLDEAIEMILERTLLSVQSNSNLGKSDLRNNDERMLSCLCHLNNNSYFQSNAVVGLAWIGKGLLMRGHEKVKEIAMLLLQYLLSNPYEELHSDVSGSGDGLDVHTSLATSAADAFHVILSDSEVCLNKKFHAMIRPLYKQRFFSSMMSVLLSSIKQSCSSGIERDSPVHFMKVASPSVFALSGSVIQSEPLCVKNKDFEELVGHHGIVALYRAFAHVISDAPLAAVVAEAKKILPSLMDSLAMLSEDVLNKDLIYSLLLVLSGILMDDNGKEAIIENINTVISDLIRLIFYPHMMLVRETAIQCLVAMSALPHARIYPMRLQVLHAVSKALDDRKRVVRQEAGINGVKNSAFLGKLELKAVPGLRMP
ncbi:putative MMS19 nucleotide excision repair protein [Cocos nucifera]|uniref:MMS19 nucleotide excision repair protein n=1 Tax=Cocos nucifera TaxID=13894 RepID=A0A8K0IB13_COCNU|nr:putative MMS19 nucleotide excision repair protein [Cocos nucifera]